MMITRSFSRARDLVLPSGLRKIEEMEAPKSLTGVSISFQILQIPSHDGAVSACPESKIARFGSNSKLVTV